MRRRDANARDLEHILGGKRSKQAGWGHSRWSEHESPSHEDQAMIGQPSSPESQEFAQAGNRAPARCESANKSSVLGILECACGQSWNLR